MGGKGVSWKQHGIETEELQANMGVVTARLPFFS